MVPVSIWQTIPRSNAVGLQKYTKNWTIQSHITPMTTNVRNVDPTGQSWSEMIMVLVMIVTSAKDGNGFEDLGWKPREFLLE